MDELEGMNYPSMEGIGTNDFDDGMPYVEPANKNLEYETMDAPGGEEVSIPTPKMGGAYPTMPVPNSTMPLKQVPGWAALRVSESRLEDLPGLLSDLEATARGHLTTEAARNLSALVKEAQANKFDHDILAKVQLKAARFAGSLKAHRR
jgi:hypothetical protein